MRPGEVLRGEALQGEARRGEARRSEVICLPPSMSSALCSAQSSVMPHAPSEMPPRAAAPGTAPHLAPYRTGASYMLILKDSVE